MMPAISVICILNKLTFLRLSADILINLEFFIATVEHWSFFLVLSYPARKLLDLSLSAEGALFVYAHVRLFANYSIPERLITM